MKNSKEQQMQHSRFLVLTGHLNDYPLSDLVGILRHQHKTGRLLIEYPNGPASLYFNDGELVDAQLDKLSGLQALCVALAQPPSSFNFNPLVRPTRRSIENSVQKVVSELLGCWSENDLEIEELAPGRVLAQPALPAPSSSILDDPITRPGEALMASSFVPPQPAIRTSRPILAMAAAGLLMLGLSTVIAVTRGLGKRLSPAPVSSPSYAAGNKGSMQQGSAEPSQNLPETEPRNESRVRRQAGKGTDAAVVADQSDRQENGSSSSDKKEIASSEGHPPPLPYKPNTGEEEKQTSEAASDTQSVKVILQIESGRVAKASIANHRSGMEAYEALALRIARQRRYPSGGAAQETVTIKVTQPK
jgi:hypothetical protein